MYKLFPKGSSFPMFETPEDTLAILAEQIAEQTIRGAPRSPTPTQYHSPCHFGRLPILHEEAVSCEESMEIAERTNAFPMLVGYGFCPSPIPRVATPIFQPSPPPTTPVFFTDLDPSSPIFNPTWTERSVSPLTTLCKTPSPTAPSPPPPLHSWEEGFALKETQLYAPPTVEFRHAFELPPPSMPSHDWNGDSLPLPIESRMTKYGVKPSPMARSTPSPEAGAQVALDPPSKRPHRKSADNERTIEIQHSMRQCLVDQTRAAPFNQMGYSRRMFVTMFKARYAAYIGVNKLASDVNPYFNRMAVQVVDDIYGTDHRARCARVIGGFRFVDPVHVLGETTATKAKKFKPRELPLR